MSSTSDSNAISLNYPSTNTTSTACSVYAEPTCFHHIYYGRDGRELIVDNFENACMAYALAAMEEDPYKDSWLNVASQFREAGRVRVLGDGLWVKKKKN